MKQLLARHGTSMITDTDPWEMRNKQGEPYNYPSLLPWKSFQAMMHEKESQEDPGKLPELKSHFGFRGIKEDRVLRIEYWRREMHRVTILEISRAPIKRWQKMYQANTKQ